MPHFRFTEEDVRPPDIWSASSQQLWRDLVNNEEYARHLLGEWQWLLQDPAETYSEYAGHVTNQMRELGLEGWI
jgi:hypothetical protein